MWGINRLTHEAVQVAVQRLAEKENVVHANRPGSRTHVKHIACRTAQPSARSSTPRVARSSPAAPRYRAADLSRREVGQERYTLATGPRMAPVGIANVTAC